MREVAIQFGPKQSLLGILSVPTLPQPDAPTVLIPNTGLEHRVGPNRFHVELARGLATAGLTTFRMDIAGLGDSVLPPDRGHTDTVADLRAAMDALTAQGYGSKFAGIGLCSGAHDIHQIARVDDRLIACAFIDGYVYRTRRFWLRYYGERLISTKRYANALRRLQNLLADEPDSAGALDIYDAPPGEDHYVRTPPMEVMRADLAAFMQRKMALCYLFTGQMQHEYNDRDQMLEAFPELLSYPQLTLLLLQDADHTFTRRAMRQELIQLLCAWIVSPPAPR